MVQISAKRYLKTQEEILNDIRESLSKNGFSVHEGSVCMLFASIISYAISSVYETLEKSHLNCFVSSADKEHLVIMAKDLGINVNESLDEKEIRYLITNHVKMNNSTSKDSMTYKLLNSDSRVYDVKIKEFTKGAGTFCAYIYSTSTAPDILERAKRVLENSAPCGSRYEIKFPDTAIVKIVASVSTNDTLTLSKEIELKHSIITKIKEEIAKMSDSGITKHDIERAIYSCSNNISKANVRSIEIDGNTEYIIPSIVGVSYELSQMTDISL